MYRIAFPLALYPDSWWVERTKEKRLFSLPTESLGMRLLFPLVLDPDPRTHTEEERGPCVRV